MFKILVIAYYFPPKGLSGVQRTLKFVKYFPKYNWQPTVLTSGVNAYYAYDYSLLKEVDQSVVKIVRVSGKEINSLLPQKGTFKMPGEILRKILSYFSSLFFIPDNKKGWANSALVEARKLLKAESYDLIYVTGPPFSSVSMAAQLKKEFDVPLVIDYRDLWFGYYFAIYPTPFHKSRNKQLEYKALKAADKIIVINRRIKEKIMEYYPFVQHRDIIIVPHGYDPEDIATAGLEEKTKDKLVLTHSGLFYEYITPEYLLNAFKALVKERPDIASNIELVFVGVLRKSLLRQIRKLKLEPFVKVTGYVSHIEAVKKILSSDVLWMMIGKGRNSDAHSPSKFFEYIGTSKPIIGFVQDGTIKSSLQEYKAGYICDPYNEKAIKELLMKVYEDFRLGNLPKPDPEYVEKYRRDHLTEQLAKELQFLVRVK